jgi:predicted nucleic acid-binding protein
MDKISGSSVVYIDTNIFVYFVEATPSFFQKVKELFEHVASVGARLITSEITLAECIYRPSQDHDAALVSIYEMLFEQSGEIDLVPLDGALAKRAAVAGGGVGLKLIDAIHYMSALEAGCDFFVTSDSAFRSGPKMAVLRVAG